MPRNRYYYYDETACSFVEVKPKRTRQYVQASLVVVVALVLAGLLSLSLNAFVGTPHELALEGENEALQAHLAQTQERIASLQEQLEGLASSDRELYRTLLDAEPIPDDVRQAGVGGADRYERFSGFSTPTADLLRSTAEQLDAVERQISVQNASFRELKALAAEYSARFAQVPAIVPTDGPIVSGYGMRHHPILGINRMHKGVDILVGTGTPVYATAEGKVAFAGRGSGYGIHVIIEHRAAGYRTLYAHLSEISDHIRPGRTVERGEEIALSGNTGLSKAPHLHYEVRKLDDKPINPLAFFAPDLTPQAYKDLLAEAEREGSSLD